MPPTRFPLESSETYGKESTPPAPPEYSASNALDGRQPKNLEPKLNAKTSWSAAPSKTTLSNPARFDSTLPSPADTRGPPVTVPKLRSHPLNLRPLPSPIRPHCLAKDRLRLWTPSTPSSRPSGDTAPATVSDNALNRILEVIGASWADSTKVLYGNALLTYHVYCDLNGPIPDRERCPISGTLLLAFLSSCAGGASGSALSNYAAGIKAWHILHGQPWNIPQDELRLTLQGAVRLAPRSSKVLSVLPSLDDLKIIHAGRNLSDPCDAAMYACTVITFYCVARLGEFTVPNIREKFEPTKHITRSDVSTLRDKDGLPVLKFRIPVTKCEVTGEDVQCAPQMGCVTNPETALQNHLRINPAPPDAHLFAWKHPRGGLRPLSKRK